MRRFAALVRKEFRDHAVVLALCAALAPLVSWPVQRWIFKFEDPQWSAETFVPLLVGIFVVLLASDLFATDLATRRMDAIALLPIPLRVHWTARTTFLALSCGALAAWTFACQAALLAGWGAPGIVSDYWLHADESAHGFAVVALVGAGVLLFSAMGYGGFRAAVFGVFLAAFTFVAAMLILSTAPFERVRYGLWSADESLPPILIGTVVLAVASFAAFVRGRPHLGRRRPVLAWGAAPVLALLVPAAAIAGVRTYEVLTLDPGSPDVRVCSIVPSPDGRLLAMNVCRDTLVNSDFACRAWVVRVADGAVFDWSPRGEYVRGWTKDGLLVTSNDPVVLQRRMGEQSGFAMSARRPETGEVVQRPTAGEWSSGDLCVGDRRRSRWASWSGSPAKGRGEWQLTSSRDARRWAPIWSSGPPTPTLEFAVVLRVTEDGALVRTNLDTGVDETLIARGLRSSRGDRAFSPDARFVWVETDEGEEVLDATTWTRAAGPWRDRSCTWSVAPDVGAVLMLIDKQAYVVTSIVDVAMKRETPIAVGKVSSYDGVAPLPDGSVAVLHDDIAVDLLAADGKFIRRLYPSDR